MTTVKYNEWKYYLEKYSDLIAANIDDDEKAYHHYMSCGIFEDRIIAENIDSSPFFLYSIDSVNLMFSEYNHVISIGHRCTSIILIREAGYKDASYPFDVSFSYNAGNVIKAIKDNFVDYCPIDMEGNHNKYGIAPIIHYSKLSPEERHEMYKRRGQRFMNILNSDKKVLFIYANEDFLHNKKYRENNDELYNYVVEFVEYIKNEFSQLSFQVLFIDSIQRKSTNDIISLFIDIPKKFITDTEIIDNVWNYRNFLVNVLRKLNIKLIK